MLIHPSYFLAEGAQPLVPILPAFIAASGSGVGFCHDAEDCSSGRYSLLLWLSGWLSKNDDQML